MHWPIALSAWWENLWRPKPLGFRGERAAEKFLKRRGYKIVSRGLRLRGGELDLIAADGRTIVFVEVKTRRTARYGQPAEAVDFRKQWRLTRAALMFLKRHGLLEHRCRFDVMALTWPHGTKRPKIQHIQNAFEANGPDGMFT